MAISLPALPLDIYTTIGVFQNARGILRVSQTCKVIQKTLKPLIREIAKKEQQRLKIPFCQIPLTAERVVWEWRFLSTDECRAIKTRLARVPLIFYSGRFDALLYLLDDDVLAARFSPNVKIPSLIIKETNIPKALVLAHSIPNLSKRDEMLSLLAIRKEIAIDKALEIAEAIHSLLWKSYVLRCLALKTRHPLGKSIELALKIPHTKLSRSTASELIDDYFEQRKLILTSRGRYSPKTFSLVRNEMTVKKELQEIDLVSNLFWKSYALRLLALRKDLPLGESIAIALSIPHDKLSRLTINELIAKCFESRKTLTSGLIDLNGGNKVGSVSKTKKN